MGVASNRMADSDSEVQEEVEEVTSSSSSESECVEPPVTTPRYGSRGVLSDALGVAVYRLSLADQYLTDQYPVFYPNAKLMALSLLLYRLLHLASFLSMINKLVPHNHILT